MEIIAEAIEVTGPRGTLLPPTSLWVRGGEVQLVTVEDGTRAAALALTLSGRMRPVRGTVTCDGTERAGLLRGSVVIVDSPGVTAPEDSLRVRDVVAEGLALAGRGSSRAEALSWLTARDLRDRAAERFEQLPALLRTRLLVDLARERRDCGALVLDRPDRHGTAPREWYSLARSLAERGYAVIVICSPLSAEPLDEAISTTSPAPANNAGGTR